MHVWYWRQPSLGRLGAEQSTWLTWYRGYGVMVRTLGWSLYLYVPGGSLRDDSSEGGLTGQPSTSVYVDVVTCSVVKVRWYT